MEFEEKYVLEQKQCQSLIKVRVSTIEDKYQKLKSQFFEVNEKYKQVQSVKDNLEKEVKNNVTKIREMQLQLTKSIDEKATLRNDVKKVEGEKDKIKKEFR